MSGLVDVVQAAVAPHGAIVTIDDVSWAEGEYLVRLDGQIVVTVCSILRRWRRGYGDCTSGAADGYTGRGWRERLAADVATEVARVRAAAVPRGWLTAAEVREKYPNIPGVWATRDDGGRIAWQPRHLAFVVGKGEVHQPRNPDVLWAYIGPLPADEVAR